MLTPCYVFDLDVLNERVNYLKDKFKGLDLVYAMKANPYIIKFLEDKIDRFEVCSLGELKICKQNEILSSKLVVSGVYKEKETFDLISPDSIVTIESMKQFNEIRKYHLFKSLKLLLRLSSGNQFGLSLEEIYKIILISKDLSFEVIGLEYYSGTQKTNLKKINQELEYLKLVISDIKKDLNFELKELEYGPGFNVNYFNEAFDEEAYFNSFLEMIKDFPIKLSLEIGRSLVSSSGIYITKVVDTKRNGEYNYAIVDGGINHLNYYGQFLGTKLPEIEVVNKGNEVEKIWNICGSLCTVNDLLVKQYLTKLSLDDLIIFKNVGAYSMTEGMNLFLSHNLPYIYLKQNNKLNLVRRSLDTYKLNMLELESIKEYFDEDNN